MATMKALVVIPKDKVVAVQDVPMPRPGPREILVRVGAVALNRVDWLYTANPVATQDYRVIGSDFAGVVVEVGTGVRDLADERVKVGARVAGFVQGACSMNDRPGAFAQYVSIEWDLTWRIPTSMSFEQASTISMCGLTSAQGVFTRLQFPCPFTQTEGFGALASQPGEPVNVLINGATSSLGLFAAQLVRLSARTSHTDIRLIGVASTSHHDLLRSEPYSYDILVDYRQSNWPEQVQKAIGSNRGIHLALDAVSVSPTVEQVESLMNLNGRFAVFRSPGLGKFDVTKLKVKPLIGVVWEGLGVEVGYQGTNIPAKPAAREFATKFFDYLGSEGSNGKSKLEANPVRHMSGGLEKISEDGLALVGQSAPGRLRPVSAEKVVYTIQ